MGWPRKAGAEMLHHYLNSHASVCVSPPSPKKPPMCTLPTLPQHTQRPWTRLKDHLCERGDPLCYVSAREWNNMESSSANNSQWRSFSTCCLTKGKIRTDDIPSRSLSLWTFAALLCSHAALLHLQLPSSACRQPGGPDPFSSLVNRAVWDMRPHS